MPPFQRKQDNVLSIALLLIAGLFPFMVAAQAQPGAELSGKVTDVLGVIIPNAKVVIVSSNQVRTTVTNQQGQFTARLPAGTYQVDVAAAGFKSKTLEFVWPGKSDESALTIPLAVSNPGNCDQQYSVSYRGGVTSADTQLAVQVLEGKSPLPGAVVVVTRTGGAASRLLKHTDKNGEIRFGYLESGQYQVQVSHRGYADPGPRAIWIARESQTAVVAFMTRTNQVRVCQ